MPHSVFCKKYQQQLEGLDAPPYPGPKGQDIFDNISSRAWREWQAHQTMLINERQLNMMDPDDRKFLQQEMDNFMSGEDYARAEGYTPPQPENKDGN